MPLNSLPPVRNDRRPGRWWATPLAAVLLLVLLLIPSSPLTARGEEPAVPQSKGPQSKAPEGKTADKKAPPADDGPFVRGEKLPPEVGKLVDADGDGKITDVEAEAAVKEFQKQGNARRAADRSQAILAALDKNKNGRVEQMEARAGVAQQRILGDAAGRKVAEIFDGLDADSSGNIDVWEFKLLVKKMGLLGALIEPKLAEFFNRMDASRDGRISMVEAQMTAEFFARVAQAKQEQAAAADNQLYDFADQTLAALDRNKDGRVSPREARRNKPLAAVFVQVDADRDELLTTAEMYDYLKKVRKLQNALK